MSIYAFSIDAIGNRCLLPVGVAQIAFDAEVGAELADLRFFHVGRGGGEEGEGRFDVARNFGSEEQDEFVDELSGQGVAVHGGARFEEHAEDFAAAKLGEDCGDVDFAAPSAGANDFDAGALEFFGFGRVDFGVREDEQVFVGGFDEAAGERNAEFGIEHDAEEALAAFEAAAVGEERIVGDDGADAGDERVGGVAHAVDFGAGFFGGDPVVGAALF